MSKAKNVRRPKGVPLILGDKEYKLVYDLNAFAELEELYGEIEEAMDALERGSIKAIRAILWAGLLRENSDSQGNALLTPRQVGAMLDIADLARITEPLGQALKESMPEEIKKELDDSDPL